MSFRLAYVPPPHSLHPDTLQSGRHGYAVTTTAGINVVLYFCPLHRASAIYEPTQRHWTVRTPDTFAGFLTTLASIGIVIPDDEDSREWIEACGLSGHAGGSAH